MSAWLIWLLIKRSRLFGSWLDDDGKNTWLPEQSHPHKCALHHEIEGDLLKWHGLSSLSARWGQLVNNLWSQVHQTCRDDKVGAVDRRHTFSCFLTTSSFNSFRTQQTSDQKAMLQRCYYFSALQKSWVSSLVPGLLFLFKPSCSPRNDKPTEWSHSTHTILMMKIIKVFGLESHNIRGSSRICWQNLFPWLSESVHRSDRRKGDLRWERESRWLDCFSYLPRSHSLMNHCISRRYSHPLSAVRWCDILRQPVSNENDKCLLADASSCGGLAFWLLAGFPTTIIEAIMLLCHINVPGSAP